MKRVLFVIMEDAQATPAPHQLEQSRSSSGPWTGRSGAGRRSTIKAQPLYQSVNRFPIINIPNNQ